MYHGFTESPDVIEARKQRILADYKPAVAAEMTRLTVTQRLQVLCFAFLLRLRQEVRKTTTLLIEKVTG